jgi:hypothetical protein
MPAVIAVVALALLAIGGARLPADLMAQPGTLIAKKLTDGKPIPAHGLARVLRTHAASLQSYSTADRWFALGHAHLMAGNPAKSADGFANGLRHAPARGIAWAAYANALEAAGRTKRAAAARRHSVMRAPHDPRAVRLRRP